MDFNVGDIIKLKGMGDALWSVERLGDRTFYGSGEPLSEEATLVSLYMPESQLPKSAYPASTWTHSDFMLEVPAMLVLALEANRKARGNVSELLVEQRYKRRMKKLRQLERSKSGYLETYKKENPDLLYEQETFKAEWSNLPMASGR